MAAYTASVTGNWTTLATWGGSGPPGNGDTVTINTGVVVTVNSNVTVGHSPAAGDVTKAINIASGGQLVISGATLTVRGDIACSASNTVRSIDMTGGAILELDASAAGVPATARYTITLPSQYAGSQPCFRSTGTAGTRNTIRSNAGGANARFIGSGVNYYGEIEAYYTDFLRMGDASNSMMTCLLNSASATEYSVFKVQDCTFNACSDINLQVTNIGADAVFEMSRCTFLNSVGTYNLNGYSSYIPAAGTGYRWLKDCVFDKHCLLYAPNGLDVTGSYFHQGWTNSSSDSASGMTMGTNFVRFDASYSGQRLDSRYVQDSYFFFNNSAATNPHYIQVGDFASLTDHTIQNNIFEGDMSDATGDLMIIGTPGVAKSVVIKNNICLPNAAGENSGTLFSALGNANITIQAEHNTYFTGTQGAAVGETYTGHTGMISSFKSNIAYDTSARGYKLYDSGTNDAVSDLVTSANCNYNCGYNVLAGSNGKGYNNLEFSSGSPGANDVDVNPGFVDNARDIAKWDLSLGGPGTAANAIAELMKKNTAGYNSNYSITNLLTYVRNGFKVSNISLRNAGHDGVTIGAQGYQALGNAGGLNLLKVGQ